MTLGVMRRFAAAGVLAAVAGSLAVATVAGASQSPPSAGAPHRQIGAAELSGFKVVLTVTRGGGQPPTATVTAAGFRRSGTGWKLIAVKRIGKAGGWFWFSVQTCSLDITQFKGISPVRTVDSIKVSLLATPALGCVQSFSERWKP